MRSTTFGALVGRSSVIDSIRRQITRLGASTASVLITGESGTGKELVAGALHQCSPRRHAPLVAVNCAAIPPELFESEFFGHLRGAFSGAVRDRIGRFQCAHASTLFLDEITEFPPDLQGKLLRVLEDGLVQRLGEDHAHSVDVRVIAATNRVPAETLRSGRLREDLYFRLAVFRIDLPPLRERREDIPFLIAHFIERLAPQRPRPLTLSPGMLRTLMEYHWPGNVRELINVVERALLLSDGAELQLDVPLADISDAGDADRPHPAVSPAPLTLQKNILSQEELDRLERDNIIAALLRSRWKVAGPHGAAMLLGINPSTLASRIRRMGLRPSPDPTTTDESRSSPAAG